MSNKIKLERYFYPVGQGLCCREQFILENGRKFNLVYDCGALNSVRGPHKYIQTMVKEIFDGTPIDLLFISHFHADHINLLKEINPDEKARVIKRIVIPYLTKEELLLVVANKNTNIKDIYTQKILKKAVGFLDGKDQKDEKKDYDGLTGETQYFVLIKENESNIPNSIKCGEELSERLSLGINFWKFIPFNFNFSFGKGIFDDIINRVLKNRLSDIEVNSIQIIENANKFRRKYNELANRISSVYPYIHTDDLNEQSTVLFSVPRRACKISNQCVQNKCYLNINRDNIRCDICKKETIKICQNCGNENILLGCIYFGDYVISSKRLCSDISKEMKKYLSMSGTLQIPHHGSADGVFNRSCDYKNKICVISYGIGNSYNHPHPDVLKSILNNNGYPVCVTNAGGYMQTFEFDI